MTGQANFLQSLGWAVLNSLWQLALLWVIYQVITGIFRNTRSSVKSILASTFLIGGFVWFIYTLLTAYLDRPGKTVLSSSLINTDANMELSLWLQQTLPAASVLYLVLLVFPLLHFIRNYRYVQVIRKFGLSKMNVEWRMFVNKVAARMDIRKKVQVWVSEFVSSPVTIGFLKPVILVPLAAINHLTPQQLEAVLLHELSHIKRLDYLVNLLINFIQTLLYFNPFAKAFVKIVEREREKSADEMVLQFQYDSHEYASALLMLEKVNLESKHLAIAAGGKSNDLMHRVELIMGVQQKPTLSFNKLAGLLGGLLCIISLNAILLFSKADNNQLNPGGYGHAVSFARGAFPYIIVETVENGGIKNTAIAESPSRVINHATEDRPASGSVSAFAEYVAAAVNPELINASLELVANNPVLKKYQEQEVERAMEASKKVLESVQWKVVEKSIADVFNQQEKDELKASYEKAIEKMDWKKWENNLKLAYDKIDWENVNVQLANAVSQVRLDSIQLVYNRAISKLDGARKELSLNELEGIPDTDITVKEIERKKIEVQRALNELKTVRKKTVVHL